MFKVFKNGNYTGLIIDTEDKNAAFERIKVIYSFDDNCIINTLGSEVLLGIFMEIRGEQGDCVSHIDAYELRHVDIS